MNKRIELLLMRAIQESGSTVSKEFSDKFAELIVRECARVGGDIVLNQNEDNDMGVFLGIKEHFGIKE